MPLYDYLCENCGHRFEVRQGIKEDPLVECPQCGGLIRRVIHPVGIVFKGSGFYVTDSRKTSSAATPAGEAPSAEKEKKKEAAAAGESSGAAASNNSDSKPAAATATSSPSSSET